MRCHCLKRDGFRKKGVCFFYTVGCIITLTLLSLTAQADDAPRIDPIEKKVDTAIEKHERIDSEVENTPLQGRNYGVEFNLIRLLMINDDYRSFSGTVSYFDHARPAEIALPFFYSSDQYGSDNERFTLLTMDVHYRSFLGDTLNGFYVSGFGRFARLHGSTGGGRGLFSDGNASRYTATEHKIGIGVGIGYRIFSKKRIYWGTSLSAGRYILGENDKFYDSNFLDILDEDSETILDIELLKFGYAF